MQAINNYRRIGEGLRAAQQVDPEQFHLAHHRPRDQGHFYRVLTAASVVRDDRAAEEPTVSLSTPATNDSSASTVTLPGVEHFGIGLDNVDIEDSSTIADSSDDEFGIDLDGIEVRDRTTKEGKGGLVFVVAWSEGDMANPRNWGKVRRALITLNVGLIGLACTVSSSIDSAVAPQAAAEFGVSPVVESLATAMFLLGSGVGSLFAGPLSETCGRLPIYLGSLCIFAIWVMASALSPNIGAQIVFRFLSGIFGCAPLTLAGGSISDLWDPVEKIWGLTIFSIFSFCGPMLGPVIGAFMYTNGIPSWRWTDWITLILVGLVFAITIMLMPETHPGIIQSWKAKHLRNITKDERYQARVEIVKLSLWHQMRKSLYRPFVLGKEPIVLAATFYLTVVFGVLFTFLDGYTTIFQETYGISQGLTNTIFIAMFLGCVLALPLSHLVLNKTLKDMEKQKQKGAKVARVRPETRLWWAMWAGSWAMPVSLFWLAWTSYKSISIWCPIASTVLLGFGLFAIFLSNYLYIIDAHEVNAASALGFITVVRYISSGGLTVAGVPFYNNVGHHWTVCILAVISTLCAPIPFVLYRYGPVIRRKSKKCLNKS